MPTTINISAPTMLKIGAETIESANASPNAMAVPLPKLPERQSHSDSPPRRRLVKRVYFASHS